MRSAKPGNHRKVITNVNNFNNNNNIIIIIILYCAFSIRYQMRITIKHYNKYKNKNLFTVTLESKTKTTLFTIGYKKSNLEKNYIKI